MQQFFKREILQDYQLALESRYASLTGRKEVFMGKAKFGIFGEGKEIPQLALAKYFKRGDWRAGYYRDQTIMFAVGELTFEQFFAQLYAHTDADAEPASAGRMMGSHFATRYIEKDGTWKNQLAIHNSSADTSPTASQMPRSLGLAYASKLYRQNKKLKGNRLFSKNGNEVVFVTIGNASSSEGHFWETLNASGVLQVPLVVSVWDDEYGISVPKKYHTIKGSISEALAGFQGDENKQGFEIFVVKGWDYPELLKIYQKATDLARKYHIPCLIHVTDITQPQGHSTSGSHERYKTKERLAWENEFDGLVKMKEWILEKKYASVGELEELEKQSIQRIKQAKESAWKAFTEEPKKHKKELLELLSSVENTEAISLAKNLLSIKTPEKRDIMNISKKILRILKNDNTEIKNNLLNWFYSREKYYQNQYSSHLYNEDADSTLSISTIKPLYDENCVLVDGREIINQVFHHLFEKDERVFIIGEDVGKLGDVNQGLVGIQEKFGECRITDTGIRETTILGQGIGAAMRGLKPIVEIQYLDYLLYALQTLSDDVATLLYRTRGGQKCPLIIRTRGHRLEGIWHTGSPMGMLIHSLRGIHILVPRNMTQVAGFYNTLLQSDDPALVIESLNGYRLKEKMPKNLNTFQIALGEPEILKEGEDITVVTYGSTCRIVEDAASELDKENVSVEIIDVQTLLPFDVNGTIVKSLEKTNRLVIVDEDVEGGASAYIAQQILERDKGYYHLDALPTTVTGKNHRPSYGSDGDYFSKPSTEDIIKACYDLMYESSPQKYTSIY